MAQEPGPLADQLNARLVEGDAGTQTRDDIDPLRRSAGDRLDVPSVDQRDRWQRNGDVRLGGDAEAREAGRCDAHDRKWHTLDSNRADR